jgi:hypothetical protein
MAVDPDDPQVVARLLTEPEAAELAAHLEALGIRAHVWGASSTIAWPEVPREVRVVVRRADLLRAQEAVRQLREPDGGAD